MGTKGASKGGFEGGGRREKGGLQRGASKGFSKGSSKWASKGERREEGFKGRLRRVFANWGGGGGLRRGGGGEGASREGGRSFEGGGGGGGRGKRGFEGRGELGRGGGSKGWNDGQFSRSRKKKKVQWYSAWRLRAEVQRERNLGSSLSDACNAHKKTATLWRPARLNLAPFNQT